MQRYYYHLRKADFCLHDHEGSIHANADAALEECHDFIVDIIKSQLDGGCIDLRQEFEIVNEAGEVIAVVPFSAAVRLRT